jgi:hypothetical protein
VLVESCGEPTCSVGHKSPMAPIANLGCAFPFVGSLFLDPHSPRIPCLEEFPSSFLGNPAHPSFPPSDGFWGIPFLGAFPFGTFPPKCLNSGSLMARGSGGNKAADSALLPGDPLQKLLAPDTPNHDVRRYPSSSIPASLPTVSSTGENDGQWSWLVVVCLAQAGWH